MTTKLHSLISILLTTMLVFNYAISNVVYATGSADGANQTSTQSPQEQGTTETTEAESTEANENDTDVTNDTSQQESDGSDEDSNTSLSTQSLLVLKLTQTLHTS